MCFANYVLLPKWVHCAFQKGHYRYQIGSEIGSHFRMFGGSCLVRFGSLFGILLGSFDLLRFFGTLWGDLDPPFAFFGGNLGALQGPQDLPCFLALWIERITFGSEPRSIYQNLNCLSRMRYVPRCLRAHADGNRS